MTLNDTKAKQNGQSAGDSTNGALHDVHTTLNYLIPPGPNGLQVIDNNSDTPESQRRNAQRIGATKAENVIIKDIRGREGELSLDVQGFQYLKHDVPGVTDWTSAQQIQDLIQPATEKLVKKVTGASRVVVYLDRNRFEENKNGNQMSSAHSPSHGVHTDLTHTSCPLILRKVISDEAEINDLLSRRYIVVNVWRPVKQIRKDPLAVCDWRSVSPATDIYNDRRITSEGILEFGVPVFNEKHEWFYLSGQQPNEPLMFKQLDSNFETNITLLHSAFEDPKYQDFPPRESLELKVFAFFD